MNRLPVFLGKIRPDVNIIAGLTVSVILLIFIFQAHLYIQQDIAPKMTDRQYEFSINYYNYFRNPDKTQFPTNQYPPLVYFVTCVYYKLFGVSTETSRLSLLGFSVIFILSMYGIGKELGNEISGIAVCALAASSPHILNFSRLYFLDFPQTALTALTFYLLLKSNGYRNTGYSILLGVALGLSMLIKWSTIFFIFFPLLWFIAPSIIKSWKTALTFIICGILTSLVSWRIYTFYTLTGGTDFLNIWFGYYIINILIPVIILLGISWLVQKKFKLTENKDAEGDPESEKVNDEKNNKSPRFINIINFTRTALISIVFISPWILMSANHIKDKFNLDAVSPNRIVTEVLSYLFSFLNYSFSYVWILMLTGMAVMFIYRKDLFKLSVIPLNIIVVFAVMLKFGYPISRYMLSFIIFVTVLGGWWVSKTGKSGKVVTAFIVIVSIISIPGWILFPTGRILVSVDDIKSTPGQFVSDGFIANITEFVKPLTGQYPDRELYDINRVLRVFIGEKEENDDLIKHVVLIEDESGILHGFRYQEFIDGEFRKTKLNFKTFLFSMEKFPQFSDPSRWDKEIRDQMTGVQRYIIKHNKKISMDYLIPEFKKLHGGDEPIVEYHDLSENTKLTLIDFKPED